MTQRTITLTGRPPVTVDEDTWPVIAAATGKVWDNQYEFQANRTSKWGIYVRQHDDGRALVYATYSHCSAYQNARCYAAKRGVLLPAGTTDESICDAIRNVCDDIAGAECAGDDAARWPTLAAECVADMPAEMLE